MRPLASSKRAVSNIELGFHRQIFHQSGRSGGVTRCTAQWRTECVAFNCLRPKTVIQTAALALLPGIDPLRCRKPEIVADAAHAILLKDATTFTGHFCVDEEVLREAGITDFRPYAVDPGYPLIADLFLE